MPPETRTVVCGVCGEDPKVRSNTEPRWWERSVLWATLFLNLPFPPLVLPCFALVHTLFCLWCATRCMAAAKPLDHWLS